MCARFGERPSKRFGIACETTAYAFDLAASYALQRAEIQRESAVAEAMSEAFGGGKGNGRGNSQSSVEYV